MLQFIIIYELINKKSLLYRCISIKFKYYGRNKDRASAIFALKKKEKKSKNKKRETKMIWQ